MKPRGKVGPAAENKQRHSWVDLVVMIAGGTMIITWACILIAVLMDAGVPGKWNLEKWSAYSQMISAIATAVTLAVAAGGLYIQSLARLEEQRRFHDASTKSRRESEPRFSDSTVVIDDLGTGGRSIYLDFKNTGGDAEAVIVFVGEIYIDHWLPGKGETFVRMPLLTAEDPPHQIDLHEIPGLEDDSRGSRHDGKATLFVEYTNFSRQRWRTTITLQLVPPWGPKPRLTYFRFTSQKFEAVTDETPSMDTLFQEHLAKAPTIRDLGWFK